MTSPNSTTALWRGWYHGKGKFDYFQAEWRAPGRVVGGGGGGGGECCGVLVSTRGGTVLVTAISDSGRHRVPGGGGAHRMHVLTVYYLID